MQRHFDEHERPMRRQEEGRGARGEDRSMYRDGLSAGRGWGNEGSQSFYEGDRRSQRDDRGGSFYDSSHRSYREGSQGDGGYQGRRDDDRDRLGASRDLDRPRGSGQWDGDERRGMYRGSGDPQSRDYENRGDRRYDQRYTGSHDRSAHGDYRVADHDRYGSGRGRESDRSEREGYYSDRERSDRRQMSGGMGAGQGFRGEGREYDRGSSDRRSSDRGDEGYQHHGRDAGFSWRDGSNDVTWGDMDRWGNDYSNHSRSEGMGWNRGSARDQHFWSSPDRDR